MSISKSGLKVDGLPIFFFLQGGFLYDSVLDNFVYVIKILAVPNDDSIDKCSMDPHIAQEICGIYQKVAFLNLL